MSESLKNTPPNGHGPNASRQPASGAAGLDSRELLLRLQSGKDSAATVAFDRYVARLIALVRARLSRKLARRIDAEDVVQSAYRSFFVGVANEEFVHARAGDLWRLLARIALHKLYKQVERQTAGRRAVDRETADGDFALAGLHGPAPTPGEAVALSEQLHLFQSRLEPFDQEIFTMSLQGATAPEISARLGKSVRTVRRTLAALQRQLEFQLAGASDGSTMAPIVRARRNDPRAPLEYADFVIERLIAAGGMGKVYRATQHSTGRPMALKSLHKRLQSDRRIVEKFLQEAQILAHLDHPHIVRFQGVGQFPGGGYFLTMEFIDGQNLQTVLEQRRLPPAEAVRIVSDAASAVAHAHAKGIVHGDLKPGNVLVDLTQRVVVTDFGLAQFITPHTRDRQWPVIVGGTAGYIAPEVRDGQPPTPASDVFGLGALLQALVSGDPCGPLPQDGPELARLVPIISRARASTVDSRFANVGELLRALRYAGERSKAE